MLDFTIQGSNDTRSGFGEGLLEAGKNNPKVVGLCADLIGSLKMDAFQIFARPVSRERLVLENL
jgi:transketolase